MIDRRRSAPLQLENAKKLESGQDRACQIRAGQVGSGQVRSGQGESGPGESGDSAAAPCVRFSA